MKNDLSSCEHNLCNCVSKPENNSGLQRDMNLWLCDADVMLKPTESWSHWCWELVNYVFICSRERDEFERCIWNKSYRNCRNENKWRMIVAVVTRNLCNCVRSLFHLLISTVWNSSLHASSYIILHMLCWRPSLGSGAPNENIVQNHLNIALLNVF